MMAYAANVAKGAKVVGAFAGHCEYMTEKSSPCGYEHDLQTTIRHMINIRKVSDVRSSTLRNWLITLDKTPVKPSILTVFMSLSMLIVTSILVCTHSFHVL